jgi:hypothetical protein
MNGQLSSLSPTQRRTRSVQQSKLSSGAMVRTKRGERGGEGEGDGEGEGGEGEE